MKKQPEPVTEVAFMTKVKSIRGIKPLIEKALLLYVLITDGNTPRWVKAVVIGALAYLINPVDAIPDAIPVAGLADDLAVLTAALASIKENIRPHHHAQAQDIYRNI
ncbi:MAG: DUF1232 domain-containing protein [Marinospirillum sp.]|uniref:YkvA family protein n=1 Tax=Marinospirillum sp. TaxID=2183934 RepID=UPI001A03BE8F|nr:YkvA family protein [Marinospirillum sp.]MBE0508445.1 DUF1232 domain-containing protein [Marinospirillum sp.]